MSCDCSICNMTPEEQEYQEEQYLRYEYQEYVKRVPASQKIMNFDEWIQSLPSA